MCFRKEILLQMMHRRYTGDEAAIRGYRDIYQTTCVQLRLRFMESASQLSTCNRPIAPCALRSTHSTKKIMQHKTNQAVYIASFFFWEGAIIPYLNYSATQKLLPASH
jgi:hypothetical protein